MWKHYLADADGNDVAVNTDEGEDTGLVVATRPHKTVTSRTTFFSNPTYGREMNQNAAFGGTPLLLHDGTDTGAWTFSEPTGTKWEADSTDQPHTDAKSLKCDNPNIGDIMQVINNVGPGDDVTMTSSYIALSMWIYVDKDWLSGDSFILYAYKDGVLVGNSVALEAYFNYTNYDTWHYINIPLTDMGLGSGVLDAFLIECDAREGAKSPLFYIDEWYLEASGTPLDYEVTPEKGTWFHIKGFQTTFVDAITADNADSTMPQLSYNKILDMTPATGYIYKRYSGGDSEPFEEARILSIMDVLNYPYSAITNMGSDGTNTFITIENIYPNELRTTLKAENLDKLVFTIEDNFSALLQFRICVQGYVEQRS